MSTKISRGEVGWYNSTTIACSDGEIRWRGNQNSVIVGRHDERTIESTCAQKYWRTILHVSNPRHVRKRQMWKIPKTHSWGATSGALLRRRSGQTNVRYGIAIGLEVRAPRHPSGTSTARTTSVEDSAHPTAFPSSR